MRMHVQARLVPFIKEQMKQVFDTNIITFAVASDLKSSQMARKFNEENIKTPARLKLDSSENIKVPKVKLMLV